MPLTLRRTDSGDLDLRGGRGPELEDGAEAAKAQLLATFLTQAGEWPFNLVFGVDYNGAILGKFFDDTATAALLAAKASEAPAVSPVSAGNVSFVLDPDTQTLFPTISPVYPINGGESFDFAVPTGV
jgi:hypothetical protein